MTEPEPGPGKTTDPDSFAALLPPPPSANRMHRHSGGRPRRSPEYRAWLDDAELRLWCMLHAEHLARPAFTAGVAVDIECPPNPRRDLDNHAKPILDALEAAGVLGNDRQVRVLTLRWGDTGDVVTVTVAPVA